MNTDNTDNRPPYNRDNRDGNNGDKPYRRNDGFRTETYRSDNPRNDNPRSDIPRYDTPRNDNYRRNDGYRNDNSRNDNRGNEGASRPHSSGGSYGRRYDNRDNRDNRGNDNRGNEGGYNSGNREGANVPPRNPQYGGRQQYSSGGSSSSGQRPYQSRYGTGGRNDGQYGSGGSGGYNRGGGGTYSRDNRNDGQPPRPRFDNRDNRGADGAPREQRPYENRGGGDNRGGGYSRDSRSGGGDNRGGGYSRDSRSGGGDNRGGGYSRDSRDRTNTASRDRNDRTDRSSSIDKNAEPKRFQKTNKASRSHVSLPRILALQKFACRKIAIDFVQNSRVRVNNAVVTDSNYRVHAKRDDIMVDELSLNKDRPNVYIMMHKPAQLSASKETNTRSVHSMVPDSERWHFPAGRLTKAATGLTIFTNDPEHKDYETSVFGAVEKEYHFKVHREPTKAELKAISKALQALHPGDIAAKVEILRKNTRNTWISVTVYRATLNDVCTALKASSLEVLAQHRYRIGTLTVESLTPGAWKQMNSYEIAQLLSQDTSEASFFYKANPVVEELAKDETVSLSSTNSIADDLPDLTEDISWSITD